jgi:predicted nucleic acid-binding protein
MAAARNVRAVRHPKWRDIVYDVRLVMDADAVVAAMRSSAGASAAIMRAVRSKQATLLLSVPLAMEYEAVCRRPEHRMAAGLAARFGVEVLLPRDALTRIER